MRLSRLGLYALAALVIAIGCSLVNSFDDVKQQPAGTGGSGTGTNTGTGTGTSTGTASGGGHPDCPNPVACDTCTQGECCVDTCNLCACEDGCNCIFHCQTPDVCDMECKGSGTECTAPCRSTANPQLNVACTCEDGARCDFTCAQAGCTVACRTDSQCILRCGALTPGAGGEGNCAFWECAAGGATPCPAINGWACNTNCPAS